MTPLIIPITGSVDAGLLSGLAALQQGMAGAGDASEEAGRQAAAGASLWATAADRFNETHQAVTTVITTLTGAVTAVGALADEQDRLDAMSRRLGLDFDAAAEAAGRFVDETAAMGVAARFAAADIRLTQTELNDIMRVAAATAETLGTDVAGAAEQLTEALIRGREGGLQRFGGALVDAAGHAHTLNDRFVALHTRAGEVAQATDNAATRVERFIDSLEDAQRIAAHAFVGEIAALDNLGNGLDARTEDAADFRRQLEAVGQAAAYMATRTALGIQFIAAAAHGAIDILVSMGRTVSATLRLNPADMGAALQSFRTSEADAEIRRLIDRMDALSDESNERTTMDPRAVPAAAPPPTRREATADTTARTRRGSAGGGGGGGNALAGQQSAALDAAFGAANDNARVSDLEDLAGLAHDRAAAVHEAELQGLLWSEQTRQDREQMEVDAESAAAAHTLRNKSDLESRLADQEQFAEAEKSVLASRLAAHETYAGRMRELQGEQSSGAARAAEFTNAAFQSVGKALGSHIQALATGKESIGAALEGMLADTLTSIGQEAMVKGAFETAQGLSALAGVFTAPLAPGHFAAAGAYFGVGALALAGGAALAPAPATATPSTAGGAGGAGGAGSLSSGRNESRGEGLVINVNFGGGVYGAGGARGAAREIVDLLNEQARQSGVQFSPRLMAGERR